jgi:SEC-C motif domain protein
MRSRYSAFALGLQAYIQESWHVDTRPAALPEASVSDAQQWKRLQIFSSGADGERGQVHFCATCREDGRWYELEEQSRFCREGDRWYYVDGDVVHRQITLGRNDPCPCGSGSKAKKCCGV